MAQDHFERHNHHDGVIDWNFNVVFDDQPSVAAMADKYRSLLQQPYFYDPIPTQWLHGTILRVGTVDEFTEQEMLQVADKVQERLKTVHLPEMHFGDHVIIHGNVCFKIEPESELEKLWTAVDASLTEIVGPSRTRKPPYGRFIAHTSLVYSKQRDNEAETEKVLQEANIKPARFHVHHMPLIKQRPINGHYEWEVVRDITVG